MPVPQVAGVGHVRLLRHPEPARLHPAVGLAAARLRRRQGVPQGTVGFTQDATLMGDLPEMLIATNQASDHAAFKVHLDL